MSQHDPFQELVDESRHREAVEERARERWADAQLQGDARFAGTLTDLAEQGAAVSLRTESGATHQGWLAGVAVDHVIVERPDRQRSYLALDAVTDVRLDPTVAGSVASGDREPALDRTLGEVLARVADERPRVHLRVRGQRDGVAGQLIGVGVDVASVRVDGGRGTTYVRIPAITELAFVA